MSLVEPSGFPDRSAYFMSELIIVNMQRPLSFARNVFLHFINAKEMTMELKVADRNDVTHITFSGSMDVESTSGRLDASTIPAIESEMMRQVTSPKEYVLVDLSNLEFIASLGIRLLLESAKTVKFKNAKMALLNPQGMVKKILFSSGVDKLMPIAENEEEALQMMKDG